MLCYCQSCGPFIHFWRNILNSEITSSYLIWNWVTWRIDCAMYGVPGAKNTSYRVEAILLKACSQNLAQAEKLWILFDAIFGSLWFITWCGGSWEPGYCMSPRIRVPFQPVIWTDSSHQPTLYTWTREIRIKSIENTNLDSRTIWLLLGEKKSHLSQGVSPTLPFPDVF